MKANRGASLDEEPVTIQTLNLSSSFTSSTFTGVYLATVSAPYRGIHTASAIRFAVSASGTTSPFGKCGVRPHLIGQKRNTPLYRHRRANQFLADCVDAGAVLLKDFGCQTIFF